jgi:secondary thiamine-phosphate synthase enzyme
LNFWGNVLIKTISVSTTSKTQVINVTELVAGTIADVSNALVICSLPHTTAALIICEDDDDLREDLVRTAEDLLANLRPFRHSRNGNPNAEAHLLSAFAGTQLVLGVVEGRLQLGTFQNILMLEMDGPKQREIQCFVLPGAFS